MGLVLGSLFGAARAPKSETRSLETHTYRGGCRHSRRNFSSEWDSNSPVIITTRKPPAEHTSEGQLKGY
jgi:hypothetical protein